MFSLLSALTVLACFYTAHCQASYGRYGSGYSGTNGYNVYAYPTGTGNPSTMTVTLGSTNGLTGVMSSSLLGTGLGAFMNNGGLLAASGGLVGSPGTIFTGTAGSTGGSTSVSSGGSGVSTGSTVVGGAGTGGNTGTSGGGGGGTVANNNNLVTINDALAGLQQGTITINRDGTVTAMGTSAATSGTGQTVVNPFTGVSQTLPGPPININIPGLNAILG